MGRRQKNDQRKEADARLTRRASWAAIIGVPLTVIGLVFTYLTVVDDESKSLPAERPPVPLLERVDLIPRNEQGPRRPALEMIVHNRGRDRSVITRVEIEVARVYPLPLCFTQGSLPVSETYGAQLPADAESGDVVEVPVHQQVGSNQADRFEVDFSVVGEDHEGRNELPGLLLFEVDVSLVHDGKKHPLKMGRALLSLPELPLSSEFLLLDGLGKVNDEFNFYSRPVREFWKQPMPCWRANARAAILARETDASRSSELDRVLDSVFVPTFSEVEP